MYTWRRLGLLLLLAVGTPAAVEAQWLPEGPITAARGTVTVAGEATLTLGSRDESAFFNYTDYEHNALRMFRLSLSGMWRPSPRFAALTELRSEDLQHVIPYALYIRVRPWAKVPLDVQAGRIPPVFGTFARRTYGTDNPLNWPVTVDLVLNASFLSSAEKEAILGGNLIKLLRIT